jgi:hypothetical protein
VEVEKTPGQSKETKFKRPKEILSPNMDDLECGLPFAGIPSPISSPRRIFHRTPES